MILKSFTKSVIVFIVITTGFISVVRGEVTEHKVKQGDHLSKISKKYDISVDELRRINKLSSDKLKVGQILKIKEKKKSSSSASGQYYTVESGDNLSEIGKKFQISVTELKELNQLSGSQLKIGQKLKVSKKANTEPEVQEREKSFLTTDIQTHTVKSGETLFKIAKSYNSSVDELKKINQLTDTKLKVGQVLKLKKVSTSREPREELQNQTEQSIVTHKVKKKETLKQIAKKYNMSVEELKKLNKLKSTQLKAGQKLKVYDDSRSTQSTQRIEPVRLNEKYHIVKKSQTLTAISKMYNIDIVDLLDYNKLKDFEIKESQRIWLEPGHSNQAEEAEYVQDRNTAQEIQSVAVHIVSRGENLFRIAKNYNVSVDDLKKWNNLNSLTVKEGQRIYIGEASVAAAQNDIEFIKQIKPVIKPFSRTPILPLHSAKVISEFGMRSGRMHKGIDFGAPNGEPIYAVLPGKVVFSGVQRGYGNVIILEHENFMMTVYGHNESNLVRVGEEVTQGQLIGTVGATGNANGSHLHFEYRVRGVAINPRDFLVGLP